eukprot:gene20741-27560_t
MGVRALRDWCQEFDIEYMIPENKELDIENMVPEKVPNATSLATVESPMYLQISPRSTQVPNATSLATVEGPVYLKINPRIKNPPPTGRHF